MVKTKKRIAIMSLLVCLLTSFTLALGFGGTAKANAEGETAPIELKANEFAVSLVNYDTANNRTLLYLNYFGEKTGIGDILSKNGTAEQGWPLFVVSKTDGTTDNQYYGGWVEDGTKSVFALPVETDISTWETATLKEGLYSGGAVKLVDDIVLRRLSDGSFVAGSYKKADFSVSTSGSSAENDYIYFTTAEYKIFGGEWTAFKNQAVGFSAKKSDGTVAELTSNYFQADPTTIYIKFASGALTDCVELTFPEGAYQLADDSYRYVESGFTFYKHSDGKWYKEAEQFALSFETETPFTEFKNKSTETVSYSGLVATFGAAWDWVEVNGITLTQGKKYKLEIVAKKTEGEGKLCVVDNAWQDTDKVWHQLTDEYTTTTIWFEAKSGSATGFYLESTAANTTIDFKSITLIDIVKTITEAGAIGELPAIPEKTGYIGRWVIDDEDITAETNFTATENKVAKVVYEKAYTLTYEVLSETDIVTADGWIGDITPVLTENVLSFLPLSTNFIVDCSSLKPIE